MHKRKFEDVTSDNKRKKEQKKAHSLDSDEEDVVDDDNILDEQDIVGEEEGNTKSYEGQYMTAFNMKEEMEEGHFDRDGHFVWKNEKEIRDNWLDNINWQKVAAVDNYKLTDDADEAENESSGEEDDNEFDEVEAYKALLKYMKPKETVSKTLNRLGGESKKLSSIERIKRKKEGTLASNKEVTEMTEIADKILSKKGNMDIYQETFEQISEKIKFLEGKNKNLKSDSTVLDMYSDDFDVKEQQQLQNTSSENETDPCKNKEVMWEFKWNANDEKTEGPISTKQMSQWASEGYFKNGVLVRKFGENSTFYTSNRIDFDLYI